MHIPLTPKQCLLCEEEFLCKNTRVKVPICNICVADNVDHSEVTLMRYTEIYAENVKDGNSVFAMIDFLNRLDDYEKMLNQKYDGTIIDEKKQGLARELARMNLTLNTYTQWYWKTDLLNLLNFLSLRADNHAQYEIRAYADVMIDSLKRWVPITFDAFMDYRVGGMELSAKGKEVIQKMIKGEECNFENSKLSKREWNELMQSFGFNEKIL
mgnify:CR=1 FL=1